MNPPYRFARFELNPATRQLLADGGPVTLGARAFDVLVALVERRERMVTKDELLEIAWPGLVVEENNLQVQISALRKALGPQAIATIPGKGYRFAAKLEDEALFEGDALGATSNRFDATGPAPDAKSIAVLPFLNMSEDKDAGYFADGVQDDLLTQLALLGDLKVVSRTSVAEYRDSKKNVRQIAGELGVASLLEGSVRRAGNRVRISAQLIDARTDKHLWASAYDRELKDIFAIQTELATEIAKALKVSLSAQEEERLTRRPTDNLAAYDMLLQHQGLLQRALAVSPAEELEERIALLSRAVELDPNLGLAWARLGSEHARMRFYQVDRSDARRDKAQQAIDRALALASDDLSVRCELGNYYHYGLRDYARAASYFEELLHVAPGNVEILVQLSLVRRRQGRWPEANAFLKKALAVDPRNVDALRTLREIMGTFRHWDEASALQQRIVAIRPDDLEEQARLHGVAFKKSGSFATYDAWRNAVPPDAAQRSAFIWALDLDRVAVRRDLDEVLRSLEAPPQLAGWLKVWFVKELRALVLVAKRERTRALALARLSLLEATTELKQQPDNERLLLRSAMSRAILGEREAAWADYERYRAMLIAHPDANSVVNFSDFRIAFHAALGDRDRALQSLTRLLTRQAVLSGSWSHDVALILLWDDPRFKALAGDPANNSPLPIVNWDLEKMLAELQAPSEP